MYGVSDQGYRFAATGDIDLTMSRFPPPVIGLIFVSPFCC